MPFDLFKRVTRPSSFLGVDIGTTSIKVAEVKQGKDQPELINYSLFETYDHLERTNTALQTSTLKLFEDEIAEYLKVIIRKGGFKSREVTASLPSFSAFTTIIDIPSNIPESDIAKTLGFKARQHIPLPLTSVTLDWVKVGERIDDKGNKIQQIFLISVPNEQIKKYKTIFSKADLNLLTLEVEGFSLSRILTTNIDKPTLIIDVGARSTTFLVAQNGVLKYVSQSDFAGSSLTQSIASGLGINIRRAEDLKRQKGLIGLGHGPDKELSTLLVPLLDVIINEAKRVKDNYQHSYQQKIASIILSGGGANLLNAEQYFKEKLELPVSKSDPFSNIDYPPKLAPLTDSLGPSLSVALGLGIKPFI